MCFAKQKCFLQNTNVLCQSKHICVLNQNTFVFCHTPENCCHGTYWYANISKYYERWPPPTSATPSATVGAVLAPSPLPWLPRFLYWFAMHLQEDTGLGGKKGGWQYWMRTNERVSLNCRCWRCLSHFWDNKCPSTSKSVFDKQAPQIENTNVFCETQMCFANQNMFVFWIKILLYFAICPTIVVRVRTGMQILVSTMKDDLRPHRPPPLPLPAHVGAAVTAAMAATMSWALR